MQIEDEVTRFWQRPNSFKLQLRKLKLRIRERLLRWLGAEQELARMRARAWRYQLKAEALEDAVRELGAPREPFPAIDEFFDDSELLITQPYDLDKPTKRVVPCRSPQS